ncbi:MAG TPA: hypothetical protein VG275_14465, partial [Solirubrobacteraceae bacterium]|nr:hypothetical protein [Solirubrobacteraceae bacterium]
MLINAATGGTVTSGDATLTFAPGSLPADAYVSITLTTVTAPGLSAPTTAYDLLAINASTGAKIEQFNSPPILSVAGSAPGSQVYYVDPVNGLVPIASSYAGTSGIVSAGLPHFSTYVVSGGVWNISLDDPTTENVTLRVDNSTLVLVQNGTTVESAPLAGLTGVTITSTHALNLTIDITGAAIPVPITFTGPAGFTNSISIPALSGASTWTWNGTTLTGTSSASDFQTITATGVQQLSLDSSVDNTVTGPISTSTWTVFGTLAGSVAGLSFGGVDTIASGSGSSTDTLQTPITSVSSLAGAGTVLGVAFSGMATVTPAVQLPGFSYQAPAGANVIELSNVSGTTLGLTDVNTVTDANTQVQTVTTTTLLFTAPTTS